MHRLSASFVLGDHGCDARTADRLVDGDNFEPSGNEYDWLGHGVYFWEANPLRGLEFARETQERSTGTKRKPEVVGAVIDLGYCLDLTTSAGVQMVKDAYNDYRRIVEKAGDPLPSNSRDGLRRNLDCAVINFIHDVRKKKNLSAIDTVRAVFIEGTPIYVDSGFYSKSHIQICVCNPDRIKGVFRVKRSLLSE